MKSKRVIVYSLIGIVLFSIVIFIGFKLKDESNKKTSNFEKILEVNRKLEKENELSGFNLIPKIKNIDDIPIIMLTAKSDINDKLLGLQLGADDYITKPFNSTELILRINIVGKHISSDSKKKVKDLTVGDLTLLLDERKALIKSEYINLTFKEFEVLRCLCQNKNKVFSREELLNKV